MSDKEEEEEDNIISLNIQDSFILTYIHVEYIYYIQLELHIPVMLGVDKL